MKKSIIAFLVAVVIAFGIGSPKAHADGVSSTLTYGGGCLIGLGIGSLVMLPDDKPIGIGCISAGALMAIGGIWYAVVNGESIFAKAQEDTDSPLHYVKFDTNGKDSNLSVKFEY